MRTCAARSGLREGLADMSKEPTPEDLLAAQENKVIEKTLANERIFDTDTWNQQQEEGG